MTTHTKEVKAWGILNVEGGFGSEAVFWGIGGIGVTPIQIFSSEKKARFTMKQSEHALEVSRGTTRIVPCTITYELPEQLPDKE